jgi:hypothetical protein
MFTVVFWRWKNLPLLSIQRSYTKVIELYEPQIVIAHSVEDLI